MSKSILISKDHPFILISFAIADSVSSIILVKSFPDLSTWKHQSCKSIQHWVLKLTLAYNQLSIFLYLQGSCQTKKLWIFKVRFNELIPTRWKCNPISIWHSLFVDLTYKKDAVFELMNFLLEGSIRGSHSMGCIFRKNAEFWDKTVVFAILE